MINEILDRDTTANTIKNILKNFDEQYKNINYKKGFYIYGSSGVGKTTFVKEILKELNYDIIHYDAGDVRNKSFVDAITSNNISSCNVLDMMKKKIRKIAIVMDEIDGMNSGDKGGLNALIKLIRQKKTKKQKQESSTNNPIICIGNYNIDKKIKELMKVCNVFELKTPTKPQMQNLIEHTFPQLLPEQHTLINNYTAGDLRKLEFVKRLDPTMINNNILNSILSVKTFNDDTNKITKALFEKPFGLDEHQMLMNETDRTVVALLWHENVVDALPTGSIPFYMRFLDNMCYADYIDRITFQNQIWQFNEISSLMKTFNNNRIFHKTIAEPVKLNTADGIRFTKVLTKYSTEYNNLEFIYDLCQKMDMDKKDLVAFFLELRTNYKKKSADFLNDAVILNELEAFFENYEVNKLDIKRIYRYLDHNVKKTDMKEVDDLDLDE